LVTVMWSVAVLEPAFPAAGGPVVDEGGQQVMAEAPFERRGGVLLLRVCGHQRGVQIEDQRRGRGGPVVGRLLPGRGPHPSPSSRPRPIDDLQRGRGIERQRGDRPRHRGIGGHRPVDARFGAQQVDVGQAVPAQREGERQIQHDLARSCTANGLRHGDNAAASPAPRPLAATVSVSSTPPACPTAATGAVSTDNRG
jgi:hypothetical protein